MHNDGVDEVAIRSHIPSKDDNHFARGGRWTVCTLHSSINEHEQYR